MPQADTDGMITVTETEWRETIDQMNKLVRERNAAKRQLSAARKAGRLACRLTLDAVEVIDSENICDPEDGESDYVRERIAKIQEILKPKRRRRP
jgi:hypothetical protein